MVRTVRFLEVDKSYGFELSLAALVEYDGVDPEVEAHNGHT